MTLPRRRRARGASDVQAAYFIATGIWPIVHLASFMAITGPKRDRWLVQTFGALVAAIGAAMLAASNERDAGRVGAATAVALAATEIVFVVRRQISPIYLADAALELMFAGSFVAAPGSSDGSQSRRA